MRRFTVALTIGSDEQPTSVADKYDRDQLIAALQAAHARDHDQATEIRALQGVQQALDQALHVRTIERDHFKQDGHMWALCLAYLAKQEPDEQLELPVDAVNAMEGLMLDARVDGTLVYITVEDRTAASQEGGGDGG